jgi:hypothetical protein
MTLPNSDKPDCMIRSDHRGRLLIRAEQRTAILKAFDAGSLSAMAFCRQHGLCYSTFATWIQKRRRENAPPASTAHTPASASKSFVEVRLEETAATALPLLPLTFNLPSGASVEIRDPSQLPLLAGLLRHLDPTRPC